MTTVEYEADDPFNHEWTEKALDAIKAGTLHRRLIVQGGKVLAARLDGVCPRCEHPLRPFSLPLIGGLSEGGVLGRKASLAGSTYRIDVQCGCKDTHPKAPGEITGCGIWFRVELKVGRDD